MRSKIKIVLELFICFSLILGISPIIINKLLINTDHQNKDQQNEEDYSLPSQYPRDDNPYYSSMGYSYDVTLPIYEPCYDLELGNASFYSDLINQAFGLTSAELQLLQQNKFVVLNRMGTDDIIDAYSYYWVKDLPVFITTDTILHVWHLIFDTILEKTEENIFFPLLEGLTIEVIKNALLYPELDNNTLIYFNVAFKIVTSGFNLDVPIEIEQASEVIYNLIMQQTPVSSSNLTTRFVDDYSQYKPRGHYTKTEILMKYFRLYKWFARIPFFFDDYIGMGVLNVSPDKMIKSAMEVTWLLKNTQINYLNHNISGLEIWDTIIGFLDVIMGAPSSITPRDLDNYCQQTIGSNWNLNQIYKANITQIQNGILNDPLIPEPEMPFYVNIINFGSKSPKTFTLFGEIETLDSLSLQNVVHPNIVNRLLPHVLDFAYTCLESNRSLELLQEEYQDEFINFPEYRDVLESVKEDVNSYSDEKKQSLQWNWISSLKSLAVDIPNSNEGIFLPEFMNSSAWLDEKLTTIMGSWAQLRHDTILYSKQSYGGVTCSTPTAFVEPYPEFYNSLGQLSQLFKGSFASLTLVGYNLTYYYFYFLGLLDAFTYVCSRLEDISIKELMQQPLTLEDKTFITSIYRQKRSGICGVSDWLEGWLPFLLSGLGLRYRNLDYIPNSRATLVADIHTDPNTKQVLHVSTGFMEHVIALVPSWDGHEIPVVGPVFSFYEFLVPNYNRLTDEEWRGILSIWLEGDLIESHDFDLIQRGFWSESYMVSTSITSSIIYYDDLDFDAPDWF